MTTFWNDFPGMTKALSGVSDRIREASLSDNPIISEVLESLFGGDGKLLRPGMLLLAGQFGKPQKRKHHALAAALEMLHVATLVHDDVIDDSPLRRGLPAAHVRYGRKDAVLIGDYLLSRSFLLAAEYTSTRNAVLLSKAVSVICTMELEQDADRCRADKSVRRYFRKILGKTALLFSLACQVGASEAKAVPTVVGRLRRIGYATGMAFQIIDDILDYAGDPGLVRKPTGNDLRSGLCTLPLICALAEDADGSLAALLWPDGFSEDAVPRILELTSELGGIEAARLHAHRFTNRALRELERLPAGSARDQMECLIRRLLDRNY